MDLLLLSDRFLCRVRLERLCYVVLVLDMHSLHPSQLQVTPETVEWSPSVIRSTHLLMRLDALLDACSLSLLLLGLSRA